MNIYLKFNDGSKSTLNDNRLTLNPVVWDMKPDDFYFNELGLDTNSSRFFSLRYNSESISIQNPDDFDKLYYIKNDWVTSSGRYAIWNPSDATVCGPVDAGVLKDYNHYSFWNTVFTIIAARSSGRSTLALIASNSPTNWDEINQASYLGAGEYVPSPGETCLSVNFYGFQNASYDMSLAYGPVIFWQNNAGMQYLYDGFNFKNADIYPVINNIPETEQRCIDNFGQSFSVIINWSNTGERNSYDPSLWEIVSIQAN